MNLHTYRVSDRRVAHQVARTVLETHRFVVTWTGVYGTAVRGRRLRRRDPLVLLTLTTVDFGHGLRFRIEEDGRHDIKAVTDEVFQALVDARQNQRGGGEG